jgi:hypothetical protein
MMLEQLTANKEIPAVKIPTIKRTKKLPVVEEPVYVEEQLEIKVPKKRVSKKKVEEVVELPKPTRAPPPPKPKAPRKKKLAVEESPSNQFYGNAPEPEQQEVYYESTNPLLEKMAMRRRMGSYY